MNAIVEKGFPVGTVDAPRSKSYAHRLLVCAALAGGGEVSGVEKSDDISATLGCLSSLGAKFIVANKRATFFSGPRGGFKATLDCKESGSTLRFMIPVALALGGKFVFKGSERLFKRGISEYEKIFREQEIYYEKQPDKLIIEGKLNGGEFKLKGDESSQFITGLLLAAPILGGAEITTEQKTESRPYVDITIDCMKKFFVSVGEEEKKFTVFGGQKYCPNAVSVERDWSNGAFLGAFAALGADFEVKGLNARSKQGDKAWTEIFVRLKEGFTVCDLSDTPDLAPIVFALAAALHGGRFTGTKRLKVKESDRAEVMREELEKFGAKVEVGENEVSVLPPETPINKQGFLPVPLFGHNDHRVVMSLAVLSTLCGAEINGAEAVGKSFPKFFEMLEKHGAKISYAR